MSSSEKKYVIGVDFGTDSVRSVLVSGQGEELAEAVHFYSRWGEGLYCDASENRFRHHPKDYLEGLESTLREVVSKVPGGQVKNIKAVSADTTGSTPVAVTAGGTPLALTAEFAENPNAMFILWKDHTAINEAEEINRLARSWGGADFTKYSGGVYSSEWFWAKILHTLRVDESVRGAAWSWAELCDWIPFELTGGTDVRLMKRSRCAAGHKAMWHEEFNGLPDEEFLIKLDPLLSGLRSRLYTDTYTADHPAGIISEEWAAKTGLPEDVVIGVGAFDAHMGAVGGGIEPYYLCRVMGTSTCDMLVVPAEEMKDKLVPGICGQVEGSIIPGMVGLEAGQSAFGDVYAWFRDVLAWPLDHVLSKSTLLDENLKKRLIREATDGIIPELSEAAQNLDAADTGILALDWLNGRRTPDANQMLKGAIEGLDLSSSAPKLFKALVEATCFGARMIVERFVEEGIPIKGIIGMGGVAKKSPFVMQTLADVLNMPVQITRSGQSCALGAAIFAATAAGLYTDIDEAKEAMGSGFETTYQPDKRRALVYGGLYERYKSFGKVVEDRIAESSTARAVIHG